MNQIRRDLSLIDLPQELIGWPWILQIAAVTRQSLQLLQFLGAIMLNASFRVSSRKRLAIALVHSVAGSV